MIRIIAALAFLGIVVAQQYVLVPVYVPTVNQTYPNYNTSRPNNTNYGFNSVGTYQNSTANGTQNGHLFLGNIGLYDRLLFNQVFRKEKRWWASREKTIEYPVPTQNGYTRHETIAAIRIYNQFLDGCSARATILKGGIGQQYVKIQLSSKLNKGFQYLVQIFGH